MNFIPAGKKLKKYRTIFAGGCFWGVETLFKKIEGVLDTRVGYIGGDLKNPTYNEVSSKQTDHAEAVEVIYDPSKVSYDDLVKYFFEIHDFTQLNKQGLDIGKQYRSEIFYTTQKQKKIALEYKSLLEKKGYDVVTKISEARTFWLAEDYHQNYYQKSGETPYCHYKRDIF